MKSTRCCLLVTLTSQPPAEHQVCPRWPKMPGRLAQLTSDCQTREAFLVGADVPGRILHQSSGCIYTRSPVTCGYSLGFTVTNSKKDPGIAFSRFMLVY